MNDVKATLFKYHRVIYGTFDYYCALMAEVTLPPGRDWSDLAPSSPHSLSSSDRTRSHFTLFSG